MALNNLLLHPKTKNAVGSYLSDPAQVLAIIGGEGAGKDYLARILASELLGKQDLSNESRLIIIERAKDKKEIAIEAVRELIKSLRVKQPGDLKRVVFISEADSLSREAQNALLKTLEQPNPDTYFILTVSDAAKLLPTVFSRTRKLVVHPVPLEHALKHYSDSHPEQAIKNAWLLGEGRVGQLNRLLEEDENPLRQSIDSAKTFLSSSRYERLVKVDAVSKDREELSRLLVGLARILKTLHYSNIKKGQDNIAVKILDARKQVLQSQDAVNANASAKAVLLKLILNLRV